MGKIADIKSLLSEQCIVAASQMAAAEPSQAGSVERLLSALADFPAWWDPNSPALSPYQIRQIRKLAETSLSKLKSKLRVGDYVVIQMIGRGGMGKVYKAVNAAAGAVGRPDFVALKWIKFDTQDQRQRLRREFEVMNRLKGNPSVVRAVELFSAGDADILVMEFQNRGTLAEHAVTGREEWRRVARWAATLLEGLAAAHKLGFVHRDIKPSNVMIHHTVDRDIVRLTDWGLVKCLTDDSLAGMTQANTILGTWHYMPPEQWQGSQHVGPASDIYSLGGTVYYALAGRNPFARRDGQDDNMMRLCSEHTTAARPSIRDVRPDVPTDMEAIVRRMMAINPAERGTAASLRLAFLGLLNPHPSSIVDAAASSSHPSPSVGSESVRVHASERDIVRPVDRKPPTTVRKPNPPNELGLHGSRPSGPDRLDRAARHRTLEAWDSLVVSMLTMAADHPGRVAVALLLFCLAVVVVMC